MSKWKNIESSKKIYTMLMKNRLRIIPKKLYHAPNTTTLKKIREEDGR